MSSSDFIPFALPDIGEEEIAAVVATLRSGWLTTGPNAKAFEEEFAANLGGGVAIAVNSATAGLHLALEAIGIRARRRGPRPRLDFHRQRRGRALPRRRCRGRRR
ncbi:DegT/DnrJ/EryC1/StrS family aminotransferase [Nocardioides sp. B-3]|uniref:DegT/DnrJ/EryC1/StrS family aminotransferase n=1 Tax=Nocardioides sp. B-3 TaxID=2895565 RepID=UPI002342D29C|nr:DegT/DnrJ/EryC1/StrS family aminotransferase [Nocardioides sp. B-3]